MHVNFLISLLTNATTSRQVERCVITKASRASRNSSSSSHSSTKKVATAAVAVAILQVYLDQPVVPERSQMKPLETADLEYFYTFVVSTAVIVVVVVALLAQTVPSSISALSKNYEA